MAFALPLVSVARERSDARKASVAVDIRRAPTAVARSGGSGSSEARWTADGVVRALWNLARFAIFRTPTSVVVDEPHIDTDGLEERLLAREARERQRAKERTARLLQVATPVPPAPSAQEKRAAFPFFGRREKDVVPPKNSHDVALRPVVQDSPTQEELSTTELVRLEQRQPPPPPPPPQQRKSEKRGGFLFFGRRQEKVSEEDGRTESVTQVPPVSKAYGGLYESRVYDYVAEAIDRKDDTVGTLDTSSGSSNSSVGGELQTLLPYDLQRALFDELKTGSTGGVTASTPKRRRRRPSDAEAQEEADKAKGGFPPLQWAGALVGVFRKKDVSKEEPQAGAEAMYAAAYARETDTISSADDAGLADGGAAAAYATAAAIATSATVRGRTDGHAERKLLSAVNAARAVDNEKDARAFVETVGVLPLVRAACALNGLSQSMALTALANLAIMLPKSRIDMLNADSGALVRELLGVVQGPGAFTPTGAAAHALAYTESLVSGTHLIGSLALAPGKSGRDWRLRLAATSELVRNLKRLAGGLKNGGPEGAARAARRALGALGINEWKPRVAGQRGLRILSIDGGGTRAIMAFEMLKHIKRMTGCEIHELFDVIGGTSTGAIVAASLGIAHKPVEEVEQLYRELIGKIFAKHPVNGPKLLLTRAYYDTKVFEDILKRECGSGVFLDSQAEEGMNKVFVVSSVMSRRPQELHVFRNYTYPPGHESRYDGTVEAQLWEALRASSAAPTFFSEIRVHGELHADGAIVANNPTAVAIHEAKSVYPGVPVELVVSIGNGHAPNDPADVARENGLKNVGWGEVFGSIVASATSTETVHHALVDLFPEDKYYRFNPTTDSTQIDETRPDQLALFVKDSKHYIKVNTRRFESLAATLTPKTPATLWRRFKHALGKEIQVLRKTVDDDLYLPNANRAAQAQTAPPYR